LRTVDFIMRGRRGLVRAAIKCRGGVPPDLYGPECTIPENLERLRGRGLGAKRARALREFCLWM